MAPGALLSGDKAAVFGIVPAFDGDTRTAVDHVFVFFGEFDGFQLDMNGDSHRRTIFRIDPDDGAVGELRQIGVMIGVCFIDTIVAYTEHQALFIIAYKAIVLVMETHAIPGISGHHPSVGQRADFQNRQHIILINQGMFQTGTISAPER